MKTIDLDEGDHIFTFRLGGREYRIDGYRFDYEYASALTVAPSDKPTPDDLRAVTQAIVTAAKKCLDSTEGLDNSQLYVIGLKVQDGLAELGKSPAPQQTSQGLTATAQHSPQNRRA